MNEVENLKEHFKDMLDKLEHLGKINNMTKVDFIASLGGFEFLVREDERLKAIANISKEVKKEAKIICNDTGVTSYHEYAIILSDFDKIISDLLKKASEWMEEHDAEIRRQTIEEFRNECESASYIPIGYGYYVVDMRDVRLTADLMKEQMKGETE